MLLLKVQHVKPCQMPTRRFVSFFELILDAKWFQVIAASKERTINLSV